MVDPKSGSAPFEQVRAQIAAAIDDGWLLPATRLPTVRHLASELGLAVNTVARAYRELELKAWSSPRPPRHLRRRRVVSGP